MDLYSSIREQYGLKNVTPEEVAPLILAHIGDAIYEVVVRTIVLSDGNRAIEKIHKDATSLVNAGKQAHMADVLLPMLTDAEASVYRRGRNAKSATKAKNASVSDYRKATGFEALMGYLYLKGETERMLSLVKTALDAE